MAKKKAPPRKNAKKTTAKKSAKKTTAKKAGKKTAKKTAAKKTDKKKPETETKSEAIVPEVIDPEVVKVAKQSDTEQHSASKALAVAEKTEADDYLDEIESMTIEDQDDLELAAEALAEVKGKVKLLEGTRTSATKPLNESLKIIRGWFRPALDVLTKAEKALKRKISEAHQRAYEKRQVALSEAGTASQEGDADGAAIAMRNASAAELQPIDGLQLRQKYSFEVTDFDAVPRKYLGVVDQEVLAAIRAAEGDIEIPGIKVILDTTVASKSA